MPPLREPLKDPLPALHRSIDDAAAFFGAAKENLTVGSQTAREALAHLVFWHREYVKILRHLAQDQAPQCLMGKYHELNSDAAVEFRNVRKGELARRLVDLQCQLEQAASRLPEPRVRFALKEGGSKRTWLNWAPRIEAHVRTHTVRFKRAAKQAAHSSPHNLTQRRQSERLA